MPPKLRISLPTLAELPLIRLPVRVAVPLLLTMPPPSKLAEFPERVLLVMVAVPPELKMPPPRELGRIPREGAAGDGRRAA